MLLLAVNSELRNIFAGWNFDPHPVRIALVFIEFGKALTKPVHFDPNDRVLAFLEVLGLAQYVEGNCVFRDMFRFVDQSRSADVAEQLRKAR